MIFFHLILIIKFLQSFKAHDSVRPLNNDKSSIIQLIPQNIQVEYNSNVTYECKISIEHVLDYKWFKDNVEINVTNRSNRLQLSHVADRDIGMYKCEACLDETEECYEAESHLSVITSPIVTRDLPFDLEILEKHDIELECPINALQHDIKIVWFKNAQKLVESESVIFSKDKSKLIILGTIKSDQGYYQCLVSNKFDMTQSATQLKIIQKPLLVTSNQMNEAKNIKTRNKQHDSIEIEWNHVNNAQFYRVLWTSNLSRARELTCTKTHATLEYLKSNTIYTITITPHLNANIRGAASEINVNTLEICLLNSSSLDAYSTKTSNLMSRMVKTAFKGPQDLIYNLLESQVVKLKWAFNAHGQKIDKFRLLLSQIYLNDVSSIIQDKFIDISLNHMYVQKNDSIVFEHKIDDLKKNSVYKLKIYAINTQNELSEPSNEITFHTPSDVPDSPPEITQINVLNQSSIEITWKAPPLDKQNGKILSYRLNLKEYSSLNETTRLLNVPASKQTTKVIHNLNAGIQYLLRMTSHTQNGTGPYSQWKVVKTFDANIDETRVPEQPSELIVEPTDTTILIHWSPPSDVNRTVVRKYLLKYGLFIPDNEIELKSNMDSYLIKNVVPSSQYIISLKAGNNIGYGREILKEVITKRKSVLSDVDYLFTPLNVQAQTLSQHSITLSWTDWHLKNNEDIPDDRLYKIRYTQVESGKYKYKNSSERHVQIDDLKSGTFYDFSVKLIVGKRESDWSMTVSQMTMEAIKGSVPSGIKFKAYCDKTHVNVIISWRMMTNSDDTTFVISYADEVSFKEAKWRQEFISKSQAIDNVDSMDNEERNEVDDDLIKMQAQIRRLALETIYYFKIEEKNKHEFLSQSSIVLYKTPNSEGYGEKLVFNVESHPHVKLTRDNQIIKKISIEINLVWIVVVAGVTILLIIVILSVAICVCKRNKQQNENQQYIFIKKPDEDPTHLNIIESDHMSKFISLNTNNSQTSSSCNSAANSNNPWLCGGSGVGGGGGGGGNQTTHTSSINLSSSLASGHGAQSHLGSLNEHQQQYAPLSSASSILGIQSGQNMLLNDELDNFDSASNAPSSLLTSRNVPQSRTTFGACRKSYKNLPTATATMIPNLKTYTARPYMIDNQIISDSDNYQFSALMLQQQQSPCGSSLSGSSQVQQPQVYEKLSLFCNQPRTNFIQPLKSFTNSIPNTPNRQLHAYDLKSPHKSLNHQHIPTFNPTNLEGFNSHFGTSNEFNNEMANLEGIMKDLSAITTK